MKVALVANDFEPEALYVMFRSSMEEYVSLTRGTSWNDARERTQFLHQISMNTIQVIRADTEAAGFIDFRNNGETHHLHTFIVVPAWQSKGVGSTVLDRLMNTSRKITISVLKSNPRARSLYERKGFRETSSSQHHIHLAWSNTN